MLAVFFITTADSASLVNSQLSQGGDPNPKKWVTAFWAVCMAGIAVVILLSGGSNALQGLQNFITVTALPFAVILIGMCVALVKELRNDPFVIRNQFARAAVSNAVRSGVQKYGDNFRIPVEETDAAQSMQPVPTLTPPPRNTRSGTRVPTKTATPSSSTMKPVNISRKPERQTPPRIK